MGRIDSTIMLCARVCALLLVASVAVAAEDWKLVFEDNFDIFDFSKWDAEIDCWGGGNNEQQCYVDNPGTFIIQDGNLIITPTYYPEGYVGDASRCTLPPALSPGCTAEKPTTSGRIRTLNSLSGSWLYGKVEIRARLPTGRFLWPAIWMLPTDNVYGQWAASGEIDIMEARSQDPSVLEHTIHFGGAWPNNTYQGSGKMGHNVNFQQDMHVFGVIWTPDQIQWTVDGQVVHSETLERDFWSGRGENPYTGPRQPFDQRFYLLINLAVAGGFFPPDYGTFDPVEDHLTWTSPFAIDYVRVYQQPTAVVETF